MPDGKRILICKHEVDRGYENSVFAMAGHVGHPHLLSCNYITSVTNAASLASHIYKRSVVNEMNDLPHTIYVLDN